MEDFTMIDAYRLLIGSVGDDSHSVGLSLLEIAFKENGFLVKNIGILNTLEDFFQQASNFDAVFISCQNGHVDLYLENFLQLKKQFERKYSDKRVWYVGGNLSVQESDESVIRKYKRKGFDFVSPKPISCDVVMEKLYKDLYRKNIKKKRMNPLTYEKVPHMPLLEYVDDQPMTDEEFHGIRKQVLGSYPTGQQVWDADVKRNHADPGKNFHRLLMNNGSGRNNGRPLVQPRTGVAHTSDEIDLLTYLRDSGLDISSIQLDAASRKNMYDKAEVGVLRTEKGKTSFLNGYPVPVHGVKGIEEIVQSIDTPFQIRAGSPDHRLVYEIGLAGGTTSLEGGFMCYLFPYDKSTSPVQSLRYWKYVDKLAEWYYRTYDVIVNREYFGPLTCCLLEPSIPISINIIQSILSATSGVRSISVGLAEQGNRWQDIAALWVLEKMTRHYLDQYGFNNCAVTTVYHHFMAAFPSDNEKSEELIVQSSITAALAGAHRIMTKTPAESMHIPSQWDNARGLKLTHMGLNMAKDRTPDSAAVEREMVLLEREVTTIMKRVRELGAGSVARGAIKAFEQGLLDIPFAPSMYCKHNLITARDCDGAIRFVNPEQLPFENDIVDFHKEKIHQRMTAEGSTKTFEMLEKDLTRIWKNDYVRWPLNGHYIY
jgi:methylaspartate mutase epsilon subunit